MTTYSAWFAAGFRDLISVVPPGAPLSERTKLRPRTGGKSPAFTDTTAGMASTG
ncbi:hypothetical protein [Azospirillum brasilense]|uniref:hypothetical protein n=1 Tax=Azospirillum brasilense TaxID=192 RepID=UPI001FFEADFC|nr:hypothetical protein [Azospirillum brasilense]